MRAADYDPRADHDRDLFAILDVPWNAADAEMKAGWRAMTFAKHPDTGGDNEGFLAVQYAWEILSDPTCRSMYVRAYLQRHPRDQPRQERATKSERHARSGAGKSERRAGQSACTGVNSNGSLCTRAAMPGSDRCTMHFTQTEDEIDRILRTYARNFFCKGKTREGFACGNPPSKNSEYCWRHGGSSTPNGATTGAQRQRGKCPGGPGRRLCIHTCLVGEEACWDHATEEQRQAAVRRVEPGRCAAATQRGFPCSQKRWQDFPLCHSHVTSGLLNESLRGRGAAPPSGSRAASPKPPSPPTAAPTMTPSAQLIVCLSCGAQNRVSHGSRHRCGRCGAKLGSDPSSGGSGGSASRRGSAGPVPGHVVTLEGVGRGRSRAFTIPSSVRAWRITWSCGPGAVYPLIFVERFDGFVGLGSMGGSGLRNGYSEFSDTGAFYLECNIDDWWRAEVDIIE